jgi:DNA-binding GntR family transcriptional regulator
MTDPVLSLVRTRSLADQVADSIVEGIANGALAPGQKIIEADLANKLQVSRVPVREALKILEAQGIVVGRPHRGVRVVEFDRTKIAQVYEIRLFLEKIAIRDARAKAANMPKLLANLGVIIDRMEHHLARSDLLGVMKADMDFHHEICLASENEIVIILWETLARHMMIIFEHELEADADRAHIVDHHRKLKRMLEAASPKELEGEIERHIMRIQGMASLPKRQSERRARASPGGGKSVPRRSPKLTR